MASISCKSFPSPYQLKSGDKNICEVSEGLSGSGKFLQTFPEISPIFSFIECGRRLLPMLTRRSVFLFLVSRIFTSCFHSFVCFFDCLVFFFSTGWILELVDTIFWNYISVWYPVCWLEQFCQCGFVDRTEPCLIPLS